MLKPEYLMEVASKVGYVVEQIVPTGAIKLSNEDAPVLATSRIRMKLPKIVEEMKQGLNPIIAAALLLDTSKNVAVTYQTIEYLMNQEG